MTINVASTAATGNTVAGFSIEDFLKILGVQLSSQDPLKPIGNQEFVTQIAQFTSLEQTREMNAKIDSLVAGQSLSQSVGLLGRSVDLDLGGGIVTGHVAALSLQNDVPALTVTLASGELRSDVSLSNIVNIR